MTSERDGFWSDYYTRVTKKGDPWLDYSNERVQAQTFGLCLEAAGPVADRRCLDAGCGRGQFSSALHALRAREVVGIDVIEELIASNRRAHPGIKWHRTDVQDLSFLESLGDFDLIFLVEILQYISVAATVSGLWRGVAPGGRLVGMLPNRECPIIARAMGRFEGHYAPLIPGELAGLLDSLPDVAFWSYRGLHFGEDQRLAPYRVSDWSTEPIWDSPPNRLQFVVEKKRA